VLDQLTGDDDVERDPRRERAEPGAQIVDDGVVAALAHPLHTLVEHVDAHACGSDGGQSRVKPLR
jgi:hypothetical protein